VFLLKSTIVHCFERVQIQVMTAPDNQFCNLLSVSRPTSVVLMVQGLDVNFQVDAPLTDGVATENWESLVRRITGRISC